MTNLEIVMAYASVCQDIITTFISKFEVTIYSIITPGKQLTLLASSSDRFSFLAYASSSSLDETPSSTPPSLLDPGLESVSKLTLPFF